MNDNKRKFIISVIGIFILIFTIIGVSYAVFNYARNGAKTNQIYTGAVAFSFTEGNDGIYLTDQYPTENVYNLVKGAVTDREKVSLSIASSISSGTVYYTIFIYNPDTSSTTGSAFLMGVIIGRLIRLICGFSSVDSAFTNMMAHSGQKSLQ